MDEISRQMAKYLFNTGKEVFVLYEDGTESKAIYEDLYNKDFFGLEV